MIQSLINRNDLDAPFRWDAKSQYNQACMLATQISTMTRQIDGDELPDMLVLADALKDRLLARCEKVDRSLLENVTQEAV